MTRLLALDSSTWWGGVALVERERPEGPPVVVAELGIQVRDSHADRLLGWIDLLLDQAGWAKSSLDGYVAIRGPGSFTGIRVGLGTIRGLSLATGRPCMGVTTLEALAEAHGPAEAERVPFMDAGRGEYYTARYDARSSPPEERDGAELAPSPLSRFGAGSGGRVLIPGPGTPTGTLDVEPPCRMARTPRTVAAAAGRLGLLRDPDRECAAGPLAPLYVRPPDAILKRDRR